MVAHVDQIQVTTTGKNVRYATALYFCFTYATDQSDFTTALTLDYLDGLASTLCIIFEIYHFCSAFY